MALHRSAALQAGLLLLVALATRAWLFGDPVIHSDEQFYLLVGDRMLMADWPYVDLFDRKPIGLFLIFAALRALGGDGVIGYQLGATLVAAATAFLVTRIARRYAEPDPSLAAGVLYLVWLVVFDGAGGQSGVWQNLFMAAGALVTVDAVRGSRRLTRAGVAAMLLFGCAMQVKYVALFEGVFFGLVLVWASFRSGRSAARIAGDAAAWVAAALAPTALAWGAYAAAGHGEAFLFANFVSIFGQLDDDTRASNMLKLAGSLALAAPLLSLAWIGHRRARLAARWCAAALIAILIMGTFEQLYFLPLALPAAAAAAAGLRRPEGRLHRGRFAAALVFGIVAASTLTVMRVHRRGDAQSIARLTALIGQRPAGCLFTFGSEPILYDTTHSCLPTPYIFRSHLGQSTEMKGLPVDPVAEVARVLAAQPGVIVMRAPKPSTNPLTARLVEAAVAARYRAVGTVRVGTLPHTVYRLRADAR